MKRFAFLLPSYCMLILLLTLFASGDCFVCLKRPDSARMTTTTMQFESSNNNNNSNSNNKSPFQGFSALLKQMDDVIDDFMCKRMGNGEVFYGKRKYNPSGKVDGVYNGMGMSDKTKIDITREYKEMVMEERRRRSSLQSSSSEE